MYSLPMLDELISTLTEIRNINFKQLELITFLKTTYPNIKQIDLDDGDILIIESQEKIEKKILSVVNSELNCLNTIKNEIDEDSTDIIKIEKLFEELGRLRQERREFIVI